MAFFIQLGTHNGIHIPLFDMLLSIVRLMNNIIGSTTAQDQDHEIYSDFDLVQNHVSSISHIGAERRLSSPLEFHFYISIMFCPL